MAGLSLASLQARLLKIADCNVVGFFEADEHGRLRLRDLTALPSAATAPISELRVGAVKVKTCDKLHALDSLLKTINGFAPEDAVNVAVSLETLIAQSMLPPEERDPGYRPASNLSARRTSTEATAEREVVPTAAPAKRLYRRGGGEGDPRR
jgi:hypothetical protein